MHGSKRQRREFKEKGFRRARVNTLTCSLVSPHKDCSLLGLWVCVCRPLPGWILPSPGPECEEGEGGGCGAFVGPLAHELHEVLLVGNLASLDSGTTT
ncbi:hypothetical protein WN944_024222 [Citrus x changshan-huyou]|uniref:Uncharacterized protein n=1 Tax=Citrus x changshan-huyou TaxID=2935761 RepID=A0AAP0QCE1_9ROSI